MKWVSDNTGRFSKRPHYLPEELDFECEKIVVDFLARRYGKIEYPIATDDLTRMLEQAVASVDFYADVSRGDGEVWALTEFCPPGLPRVRISRRLSEDPRYENPLRTTITHEHGHVKFHGFLFEMRAATGNLFASPVLPSHVCRREKIESPKEYDWMEWQAAYVSGALLMPKTAISGLVRLFLQKNMIAIPRLATASDAACALIDLVMKDFRVSRDAARVRLTKLNHIAAHLGNQNILLT